MTERELDQLMRRILLDATKAELAEQSETQIFFTPSKRYEKQMNIMRENPINWMRQKTSPLWKTVIRRIAVVLLALLIGFGGIVTTVPSVRAAVVRWVTEWYETHIVYRYSGEDVDDELPQYEIADLPAGYVETERTEFSELMMGVTYQNDVGNVIWFNYEFMQQGGAAAFDAETSEIVHVSVNHNPGQFFKAAIPGNFSTIVWVDSEKKVLFDVSGDFEQYELIEMAESVCLPKK